MNIEKRDMQHIGEILKTVIAGIKETAKENETSEEKES